MTLGEYKNYPSWMKANMNKCKCGSVTAMFYDEGGDYHVECIKCGIVFKVNTSSLEEAKNEWNRTAKEPECGDFAKCKDGQCGIVTGVTDSKWGRMILIATADMRIYHFPLNELVDYN